MSKDIITTYHTLIAEVLPLSDGGVKALVNFKLMDFFKELVRWGGMKINRMLMLIQRFMED